MKTEIGAIIKEMSKYDLELKSRLKDINFFLQKR